MRTICKYELAPQCKIVMPVGAKPLSVHEQRGNICLWAEVDPNAPYVEPRRFVVYGTGHPMLDGPQTYIGTALLDGGALVFHVYELEPSQ